MSKRFEAKSCRARESSSESFAETSGKAENTLDTLSQVGFNEEAIAWVTVDIRWLFYFQERYKMNQFSLFCLTFLCCGILLMGCSNGEEENSANSEIIQDEAAMADKSLGTTQKKGKDNSMIASVNGNQITQADLQEAVQSMLASYEGQVPPEQLQQMQPMIKKQALENLINQKLLLQQAEKAGITADEKLVDARIKDLVSRFPSEEACMQQIQAAGYTKESLRNEINQNLTIEAVINNKTGDIPVAATQEVEAYFNENPEEFNVPERAQASHILIAAGSEDNDDAKAQKRLQIAGLKGEIEKGADFGKLAMEHSDCPSKAQGGNLGFFERGKMVKEFEDVAFSAKIGEVSDIVETQFGYHLIKVTERQDAGKLELAEVRDKVQEFLTGRKKENMINDFLEDLRGNASIEYTEGYKP